MAQGFIHPRLGAFTDALGDGVELWGETVWQTKPCKLTLIVDEVGVAEDLAATACQILDREQDFHLAVQCAVTALYTIWQTEWRDEDEADLPLEEWLARLVMNELSVYPEQHFEIWLDDGDLFAGHSILIPGTLADGLGEAHLAG